MSRQQTFFIGIPSPAGGSPVHTPEAQFNYANNVPAGAGFTKFRANLSNLGSHGMGVGDTIDTGALGSIVTITAVTSTTFDFTIASSSTNQSGTNVVWQLATRPAVSSIINNGAGVASVTLALAKNWTSSWRDINITGATPSNYNVTNSPFTITGANTFTYPLY